MLPLPEDFGRAGARPAPGRPARRRWPARQRSPLAASGSRRPRPPRRLLYNYLATWCPVHIIMAMMPPSVVLCSSASPPGAAPPPAPPADAALLARVRAEGGRPLALQIYRRFSDQVNATLWRLLGPDPDHDDLVNDVFLKVIGGIHRVREAERLSGWVTTVAVNVVRDELRKRATRRRFFRRLGPGEVEDHQGAAADLEGRRLVRRTFAVLSRLPADDRLAFSLRFIDQRTLPETAELCGCSLATVKRRIARAQRRFRKLARAEPELASWLEGADGTGESP